MEDPIESRPEVRVVRRGRLVAGWLLGIVLFGFALAAILVALRLTRAREKETIDRFAVVEAVRKVLKLATVETQISEVVTYRDVKPVLYFFSSEKNAILRVRGRVSAGIDLTSKRLDIRIDERTRRVTARLPHASVLAIDPTIEILDENSGWRNVVTREDRNLWLRWARGDLRRAALDSGILRQAEKNASELMSTLASAYGYGLDLGFEGEPVPAEEPESVSMVPKG